MSKNIVKLDNSKGTKPLHFVPYRQNFPVTVEAGSTLEFKSNDAATLLYYIKSVGKDRASVQSEFDPDPGPEPGGLTEFRAGQTISGIIVDPTAIPSGFSSMAEYITTTGEKDLLMADVYISSSGFLHVAPTDDNMAIYFPEPVPDYGIETAGWWNIVDDTPSKILEQITIQMPHSQTLSSEDIDEAFAPLNGVVLGAVEGQPAGGLTPFTLADIAIGAIQFAGDPDDVSAMLSDLDGKYVNGWYDLMTASAFGDDSPLIRAQELGNGSYLIAVGTKIVFSTFNNPDLDGVAVTYGWQASGTEAPVIWNGDTKQVTFTQLGDDPFTVAFVSADGEWNGTVFGKVTA